MKKSITIIVFVIAVFAVVLIWQRQGKSIIGCYVATPENGLYTLKIDSVDDMNIVGSLSFKNNGLDSSSGPLNATYTDGILKGIYSLHAEGSSTTLPVIFKKVDYGFIRGSGPETNILYDASSTLAVFTKTDCQ